MEKLFFPDLHNLCVASFKDKAKQREFEEALAEEQEKIDCIFNWLVCGACDCFFQKDTPSEKTDKSLIRTWTRSTRPDVAVQATVWLCHDNEKSVMALSHYDANEPEDLYRDADPSDGYVYGFRLDDPRGILPPGAEYMQTVIE